MNDIKPKRNRSEEYRKRNAKKRAATKKRLNAAALEAIKTDPKGFSLIDEIKASPYYGKSNNDERVREVLNSELLKNKKKHLKIFPGQLILFKYFDPIHREELEYYDASPCTIFFGLKSINNKPHVIGFNIHYYPPNMRYMIMNKIFEIYSSIYKKYFVKNPVRIDDVSYKELLNLLAKAKLDFGVREYDVRRCKDVTYIPPNYWQIAVFTEGWFKKTTRAAIMNYWKNFKTSASQTKTKKSKDK